MKKTIKFLVWVNLFLIWGGFYPLLAQEIRIGSTAYVNYSICENGSVILQAYHTDPLVNQWYWTSSWPSDLNKGASTQNITLTSPDTTFVRYVVYFGKSGTPMGSAEINITVNPATTVNGGSVLIGCQGDGVLLSATYTDLPSTTYQWQDSTSGAGWTNIIGATSYQYNVVLSVPGPKYRCLVTSAGGCISITGVSTVGTVNSLPTATFGAGSSICAGSVATLNVTPASGIAPWSIQMTSGTGDLVAPSNINPVSTNGAAAVFTVQPSTTKTYNFSITDANGCVRNY